MTTSITINRAPVLTLWGAVVAERMGYDRDASLTLGKCLAGLNAQSKGRSLGIFKPRPAEEGPPKKGKRGEEFWVDLCGRPLPARNTDAGVRAVVGDEPIDPAKVATYLEKKFGEDLGRARDAMTALAKAFKPVDLAARAYRLYETFRPDIPKGKRGWGVKGELDLALIWSLAKKRG